MPNDITLTLKSTSRQIVLSYTAPDTSPCTVEVSESPTFSPVVNDVDNSLFSGSNSDDRTGALGAGTTSRQVLIGTIQNPAGTLSNLAGDSNRYSRSLQVATTHYIRVTCGTHTGTGSIATKNVPLGVTRADELPIASAGVYAFPTIDDTNRNQTITDPATGILLRKVNVQSEVPTDDLMTFASGSPRAFALSTITDSHGTAGYLAAFPTYGGSARLYFITDTESRHLGTLRVPSGALTGIPATLLTVGSGVTFGTDPTQFFNIVYDNSNYVHVVRLQLPASGDTYYDTSVAAESYVSGTWTDMTPSPNHLTQRIKDFATINGDTFDDTKFAVFTNQVMQGQYLHFSVRRGSQDSYAWMGVVDTSTNPATVVAAMPMWKRGGPGAYSFRWCGFHGGYYAMGTDQYLFSGKTMYEGGIGKGPYNLTLSGAMTDSQTTITFNSNTPTAVDADTTLYDLVEGDEFKVGSEYMHLGSFVSGTTWNVTRARAGSTAVAHSDGATVQMECRCHNPNDPGQDGTNWWNFLADPYGNDTTNTNLVNTVGNVATFSGHKGLANGRGLSEAGWSGFIGTITANNTAFLISDSPTFAGASKSASGNAWQKHPGGPQQINADAAQSLVWGTDNLAPFGDPELTPTSLTNITGSLWKWVNTNYSMTTTTRKKLPMLANSGAKPLLDISSTATGDVIVGTSGDNYKYCIANAVNECRTGSAIGDIYINSPDITGSSECAPNIVAYNDASMLCFSHLPAYGASAVQVGIVEANSTGKWVRSLTQGLMPMHVQSIGADAHPMPDGRWLTYMYTGATHTSMWLAKAPPWPGYDGIDRNDFIQKPITVASVGGADNSIIEFGYDPNFYCTSRNEVCVSAASNNPYFFASESFTGVTNTTGCTINIPVIPNRVVYYRIKWRNGTTLVQTSDTFLLAEDSAPLGAAPSVKLIPICM